MALGGIINILLDPVLVLWLDMGIEGAAIATAFSNSIGVFYFFGVIYKNRKKTVVSISPKDLTFEKNIKEEWGKYAGNVRPRWQAAPINSSVLMPAARHTTTASIVSNGMILRESTEYCGLTGASWPCCVRRASAKLALQMTG